MAREKQQEFHGDRRVASQDGQLESAEATTIAAQVQAEAQAHAAEVTAQAAVVAAQVTAEATTEAASIAGEANNTAAANLAQTLIPHLAEGFIPKLDQIIEALLPPATPKVVQISLTGGSDAMILKSDGTVWFTGNIDTANPIWTQVPTP